MAAVVRSHLFPLLSGFLTVAPFATVGQAPKYEMLKQIRLLDGFRIFYSHTVLST
jgi:hypothetical protein